MAELTELGRKVFDDRYALKDIEGNQIEKEPEEMFQRVSKAVAEAEENDETKEKVAEDFYDVMKDFMFISGGRILSGAGAGTENTLYNCFYLPSPKDSRHGIFDSLRDMVDIMSAGGGVGINISSLRPEGAKIYKVNGYSSGAVGWGELFSQATGQVSQGGCFVSNTKINTRRGLVDVNQVQVGDEVWTHEGWKKVTNFFNNGEKQTYRIQTEPGYELAVSSDHRCMIFNNGKFEMKKAEDITEDDYLVLLLGDGNDQEQQDELNEDLSFLLGVYMSNKATQKYNKVYVSTNSFLYASRIRESFRRFFGVDVDGIIKKDKKTYRVTMGYELVELIEKASLQKQKGLPKDGFIPEMIFRSNKGNIRAFLAGMLTPHLFEKHDQKSIVINTNYESLAKDLQQLFLYIGIPTYVNKKLHENDAVYEWQVVVKGFSWVRKTIALLRRYIPRIGEYFNPLRDFVYSWPYGFNDEFSCLNGDVATRKAIEQAVEQAQRDSYINDYYKDLIEKLLNTVPVKVSKVIKSKTEKVYDLEVEDVHLLSGNGFYTSNSRRGALILILECWHPDLIRFIRIKNDPNYYNNANISVAVTKEFMEAVKNDDDWTLIFPDTTHPEYDEIWDGDINKWMNKGLPVIEYETLKARDIYNEICENAHTTGDPGLFFIDNVNHMNNLHYLGRIRGVNPCVVGSTFVTTSEGIKPISDMKDKDQNVMIDKRLVDGEAGYQESSIDPVWFSGAQKIQTVITEQGREINCTPDHTWVVQDGDSFKNVKTLELEKGMKVPLFSGELEFNNQKEVFFGANRYYLDFNFGYIIGRVIEKGNVFKDRGKNRVKCFMRFNQGEEELKEWVKNYITENFGESSYSISKQTLYISGLIRRFLKEYQFMKQMYKNKLPYSLMETNSEFLKGVCKAFVDADGTEFGGQILVRTYYSGFISQVQTILQNFGIVSTVRKYIRAYPGERIRKTPPKSGMDLYELVIEPPFVDLYKQRIEGSIPKDENLTPPQEYYWDTIRYISPLKDTKNTFNMTVHETNTFVANGIVIGNCGEIPLPDWGVCCLGHIVLPYFYDPYKNIDWSKLEKAVRIGVRFLDNVIDITPYRFEENRKTQELRRQIGLGTMGLADLMIKLKVRYGSDECLEWIDRIYSFIRDCAYDESVNLAEEKGAFPAFKADEFLESEFVKQLPKYLQDRIREHGIRNSSLLTDAPTGSTGYFADVSSGIEPNFAFSYTREDRLGKHKVYHTLYKEWIDLNEGEVPDYFVTALDIDLKDKVRVQARVQKYRDNSISSTINAPKNHTVEEVKDLFMQAWELGCKGITYFRQGSNREGVLKTETQELERGEIINAQQRAKGERFKLTTGCGSLYLSVFTDENNNITEVFTDIGQGNCISNTQALSRMVSLALRGGISVEAIADQLKSACTCPSYMIAKAKGKPVSPGRSCPSSIAYALEQLQKELGQKSHEELQENKQLQDEDLSYNHEVEVCPICGKKTLVIEAGCQSCLNPDCLYSRCG